MKKILALVATLSSIPVIGTTTVACNKISQAKALDNTLSEELGLINELNNNGAISVEITNSSQNQAMWKINTSTYDRLDRINCTRLLNNEDKKGYATAKSKHAYQFLTEDLNIEPKSGSYFTDALFNVSIVSQIGVKLVPDSIRVTTNLTENKKDYYIESGSYEIEFVRGDDVLTKKYSLPIYVESDQITNGLISRLLQNNLVFSNYKIPGFKIGSSASNLQIGTDITNNLTFYNSYFNLINQPDLQIKIISKLCKSGTWQVNDKITAQITGHKLVKKFNFDLEVQKTNLSIINQNDFNMVLKSEQYHNRTYGSLTSMDFNKNAPVFAENYLGKNSSFKFSDNPSVFNNLYDFLISVNDVVYVQINASQITDEIWSGESSWLKILIV